MRRQLKPCPVPSCVERIDAGYFLCAPHWMLAPLDLRKEFKQALKARDVGRAKACAAGVFFALLHLLETPAVPMPPGHRDRYTCVCEWCLKSWAFTRKATGFGPEQGSPAALAGGIA